MDFVDGFEKNTRELIEDEGFYAFMSMLSVMREYNYRYRHEQVADLFPIFEDTIGPSERNSDGTALWLALGLAIKELYGFRRETLKKVLKNVHIRK